MNRAAEWLLIHVVPTIAHVYIRLLHATMRVDYQGREVLDEARRKTGQYILCFWHARFVMMPYCYSGPRIVVLSSMHRDAEALVRILKGFGIASARGSTTRGALSGMRQVLRRVEQGFDVGIAPDGPKGPRRRVQPGVLALARFTGLPVIPVTFSAARSRRLRSWDRTLLPPPFSRGVFVYGAPVFVPRAAGDEEQERLRQVLEEDLDRITDRADRMMGIDLEAPRPPVASP